MVERIFVQTCLWLRTGRCCSTASPLPIRGRIDLAASRRGVSACPSTNRTIDRTQLNACGGLPTPWDRSRFPPWNFRQWDGAIPKSHASKVKPHTTPLLS